jgi:hypothetical protein
MCDKPAEKIVGEESLTQWFGEWPCFHDAEVISIFLARNGESIIRIYPYCPDKPATVVFVLTDVTDMELADFSCQNVIHHLSIEKAEDQNGSEVYRLTLGPCYGIAGRIDAVSLRVELSPGPSADGVSKW